MQMALCLIHGENLQSQRCEISYGNNQRSNIPTNFWSSSMIKQEKY